MNNEEEPIYKEPTEIVGSTRNFEEAKSLFTTKVGVHLATLDEESARVACSNAKGYQDGFESAIKDLQDCNIRLALNGLDQASQMKNMFHHKTEALFQDEMIDQKTKYILDDSGTELEDKAYSEILNLLKTKCSCRLGPIAGKKEEGEP